MSEDIVKPRGASKAFKDDRGGAVLIPNPVLGIVKNNIDPTRSGKIQVYLKRLGSNEPDNPSYWTTVSYLSPFFGSTPNTASPDAHGDYVGNPNSYGFWATPPDLDTEVICIFVNGDPNFGYYIGAIPKPGLTHMVPAIGASDSIIPNGGEANSYGGATRLPVTEINNANDKQDNNAVLTYQPRPIHSYQAAIMFKQGLLRDPDRGPISSSSQRESPSRVFGMSTPGRPIYEGGYDNSSIGNAVQDQSIPNKNFKVIGRLGGHSFVMDDGDLTGKDQLIRLRTSMGHQILMNDAAQTLFIIHANGQSYIELGKEGTIDMYSTNSVNIRTQGDLNLHADNNINIHAVKDLNISAENIRTESSKETSQLVGTAFKNHTKADYTVKADGGASVDAKGPASLASADNAYVNGSNVNLNTGSTSLKPEAVKPLTVNAHTDTLADPSKGFAPAPQKLKSITSRAPAHTPWENANKGVDVKVDMGAASNLPSGSSPAASAVNDAVPPVPSTPTSPALVATVPPVAAVSPSLDKTTSTALVSQMAVNSATGPASAAVAAKAGIVTAGGLKTASLGTMGLSPSQMVQSGYLKPGTDVAINAAIQSGKSIDKAIPANFFTGKDGIGSAGQFINNTGVQVNAASSLLKQSESGLIKSGLITGNESPTAISGLVMSGATAGVGPTVNFAKSLTGASTASGLGLNPDKVMSSLGGSVSNLVSSGGMASALASKALGASTAADMFASITAKFKPMKAGVPQNLTSIKSAEDAASSATDAAKSAGGSFMDKATSSLSSMASKAASSVTSSISNTINSITASATGTINSVKGAIGSLSAKLNGASLTSLATSKLPTAELAKLNTDISKIASNSLGIKVPSDIAGKFSVPGLAATTKNLLGNPKIPSMDSGDGTAPDNTAKLNDISKLSEVASAKKKEYDSLREQYGAQDVKTQAAYAEFKTAQKALEASAGVAGLSELEEANKDASAKFATYQKLKAQYGILAPQTEAAYAEWTAAQSKASSLA